jgi:hypothetical protein
LDTFSFSQRFAEGCGRVVAIAILVLVAACSRLETRQFEHPIAGTEQLAVERFSITVSPDEKWLTFVEWMLPSDERVKRQFVGAGRTRISSLNLVTGTKTRHSIEALSPMAFGLPPERQDWTVAASARLTKEWFRPPGWVGGAFYFQKNVRGGTLVLDPGRPEIRQAAVPDTMGTCSDCPPGTSVELRGRTWDLLAADVSAVARNGKIRAVYSSKILADRRNVIVRILEDGDETVIVERRQEIGVMVAIATLRVSPDEKYLAYIVHSKKQAFLAGPDEELFIRDLQTGREEKIASHPTMSNLIWSPDGARLYFAGSLLWGDGMAYVVDVKKVNRPGIVGGSIP